MSSAFDFAVFACACLPHSQELGFVELEEAQAGTACPWLRYLVFVEVWRDKGHFILESAFCTGSLKPPSLITIANLEKEPGLAKRFYCNSCT